MKNKGKSRTQSLCFPSVRSAFYALRANTASFTVCLLALRIQGTCRLIAAHPRSLEDQRIGLLEKDVVQAPRHMRQLVFIDYEGHVDRTGSL
jgi:hypothetical protein